MNGLRASVLQCVVSTISFHGNRKDFHSRRLCPLCGKQIIMAHLRKTRYKMECIKSTSSSPIVSPSLQRGGTARYTHNILLYFNKELSHSFSLFNATCPLLIPLTTRCARWRPNKLRMSASHSW